MENNETTFARTFPTDSYESTSFLNNFTRQNEGYIWTKMLFPNLKSQLSIILSDQSKKKIEFYFLLQTCIIRYSNKRDFCVSSYLN